METLFRLLITCHACQHGVIAHEPSGCTSIRCPCELSRHALIDAEVDFCKRDIHQAWTGPPV